MKLDYFDQLNVVFAGYFRDLPSGIPVRRERFRMGLMTGGSVQRVVPGKVFTGECPLLFFNFRNQEYCWRNREGELRNSYFFDLAGPRADQIEAMLQRDFPSGFLPCHDPAYFRHLLEKLYETFLQPGTRKRYLLPLYAEEFLSSVYTRRAIPVSGSKYEKILLHHADRIRKDPAGVCDIESLAAELSVTPVHYRRLFKAVAGVSPYAYLQECRLSLGMKLMRNSRTMQVQEIAAQCGFSSATEFSRFFKKQTSFSPVNYCKTFFE